jgi:hypothetical protein
MKLFKTLLLNSLITISLQADHNNLAHLYEAISHKEKEEVIRIVKTMTFSESEKTQLVQAAGRRVIFYEDKLKNAFEGLFLSTLSAHISFFSFYYLAGYERSWKYTALEWTTVFCSFYMLYKFMSSNTNETKAKLEQAQYIFNTISNINTV